MSDELRWTIVVLAGRTIRMLALLAVANRVPKHVVAEIFSDAYDEARNDMRQ